MKTANFLIICLFCCLISCADHRPAKPTAQPPPGHKSPAHPAPESLPTIGGRQTASVKTRPAILENYIESARRQLRADRPAEAFRTLERALEIDGQDPMVWHLMARARLMQENPGQAAACARRSNALAGPALQKKNWLVIGDALAAQGRTAEADAAYAKAR